MFGQTRPLIERYLRIWLATALGFGLLLGLSEYLRNPLNDPDQAWQRTGMLLPPQGERAPTLGVRLTSQRRTLIFFARSLQGQPLFHDLADQADLAASADLVVVTRDGSRPTLTGGLQQFVADADGAVARAAGLDQPIDGGAPVGYVIVDTQGYIRYRTLDPGFMHHAQEIKLMLGATP